MVHPLPSEIARATAARIEELRQELGDDLVIMAHHYQNDRIVVHSDIQGDSLALARQVPAIKANNIVLCGVFFMGESAALMTRPGQKVFLPEPKADCTMARMVPGELLKAVLDKLLQTGRTIIPVAYVNTSLEVKAVVGKYGGSVCTSANADKILAWALDHADSVLFVPDRNLGRNTGRKLGLADADMHELNIRRGGADLDMAAIKKARLLLWPGLCAIHAKFHTSQIGAFRARYPESTIVVHPECSPEVVDAADAAGSTAFIIDNVSKLPDGSIVGIGTEINQVRRLAAKHAGRHVTVEPLCISACCNMASVTPAKLERTLDGIRAGNAVPVTIPPEYIAPARLTLTRMFEACA